MTEDASTAVMVWWTALRMVSVVNIVAWLAVAAAWWRSLDEQDPGKRTHQALQLTLSALFVAGCAFRSFLPWAEAPRYCLSGSTLSSAAVARTVATVAELALVTQWALTMRQMALQRKVPIAFAAACLIVPLIVFAEVSSWYSALTTNFIGSVVEEGTWAGTSAFATIGLFALLSRYEGSRRRALGVAIALNIIYIAFMCSVDVPMYFSRWRDDQAAGRHYLTIAEGWADAQHRRVVTRRWEHWRQEIPWMSLYFSAGVWISLGLAHAATRRDQRRVAAAPEPLAALDTNAV